MNQIVLDPQLFFHSGGISMILLYFLWKEFQNFIRKKNNGDNRGKWNEITEKIDWLYDAHHKFDANGIPLWYSKASLEHAIEKLADNIDKQTTLLSNMIYEMRSSRKDIERLESIIRK